MDKFGYLSISHIHDESETREVIKILNERLIENNIGEIKLNESDDYISLRLMLTEDYKYKRTKSRSAGAKEKFLDIKYREVQKMQETMTNREIAEKLGISRSTFQRRLITAKEKYEADPTWDWYF